MNQQERLQEITGLFSDASNMIAKANKLGDSYTRDYCPYKVGQRLIVRPKYQSEIHVVIEQVRFFEHSTVPGLASLICVVWTKGWKKIASNRNRVFIRMAEEIIQENG